MKEGVRTQGGHWRRKRIQGVFEATPRTVGSMEAMEATPSTGMS